MAFKQEELEYDFDALEPHIDAQTMELHYSKHHAGYTAKLNSALENQPDLLDMDIEELLKDLSVVSEENRQAVTNNGGGYYNHLLFWKMMSPNGGELKDGELKQAIESNFGSVESFKEKFSAKAGTVFGSGWVWLIQKGDGSLAIKRNSFQNNPIMQDSNIKVLLGLDVWEHAYYLKYQNRRPEYITSWWNTVNWDYVESRIKE